MINGDLALGCGLPSRWILDLKCRIGIDHMIHVFSHDDSFHGRKSARRRAVRFAPLRTRPRIADDARRRAPRDQPCSRAAFVDAMKTAEGWQPAPGNSSFTRDANGWPTSDAAVLVMTIGSTCPGTDPTRTRSSPTLVVHTRWNSTAARRSRLGARASPRSRTKSTTRRPTSRRPGWSSSTMPILIWTSPSRTPATRPAPPMRA